MNPRPKSAGTAGVVTGVLFAILFLMFIRSGATPAVLADPAKAVSFISQNAGQWRSIGFVGILATIAAVFYFPGLAARLRDRTPTRATGVLYLSLLAVGSHGVDAVLQWVGDPAVATAADQVAATHAWVALSAVHTGLTTFANIAGSVAFFLAGWAAMTTKAFSPGVSWAGLASGVVGVVSVLIPMNMPLFGVSFALFIIFLIWSGWELRKSK